MKIEFSITLVPGTKLDDARQIKESLILQISDELHRQGQGRASVYQH